MTSSLFYRSLKVLLRKASPETAKMVWGKAQRHVATRWGILKQQAAMSYDIENPFDLGGIDREVRAAPEVRAVTFGSVGLNMPAGAPVDEAASVPESTLDLYDSNV